MDSILNRKMNENEEAELKILNSAVVAAIAVRRIWLDKKMVECSYLKVGDYIYDIRSKQQLGKVSKIYRYWRDRELGIRDDSLEFDYEFNTHENFFDNTSRYGGKLFFGMCKDVTKQPDGSNS